MKIVRFVLINMVVLCLTIFTEGRVRGVRPIVSTLASQAQPAPKAVIPYTSFDFGDVYTGEVISQIFLIKNVGNADLQITDFKAECACTVVHGEKVIAPGKEGFAEIEVQTISQTAGIVKIATMHTNDPDLPLVVFKMTANVLKGAPLRQGKYIGPIFLSPDSRGAMFAMPGKKTAAEFSITAEQTPVKILRVQLGTKNFVARVVEVE